MIRWLWILLFGKQCEHAWQVVVEREFPSITERMSAAGRVWIEDPTPIPEQNFTRLSYFILTCPKCGALREFRVDR